MDDDADADEDDDDEVNGHDNPEDVSILFTRTCPFHRSILYTANSITFKTLPICFQFVKNHHHHPFSLSRKGAGKPCQRCY